MIVKATIKDNDFTEELGKFFSRFESNILHGIKIVYGETSNGFYVHKRFIDTINPNVTLKITRDDKKFLEDIIKKSVTCYFNDKYIADNIKITFPTTYKDSWENGESLYYFTNSKMYIIN